MPPLSPAEIEALHVENDTLKLRVAQLEGNRGTHLDRDALQKWQAAIHSLEATEASLARSEAARAELDEQLRAALAELNALRGLGTRGHGHGHGRAPELVEAGSQTASPPTSTSAATQTDPASLTPRLSSTRPQRARSREGTAVRGVEAAVQTVDVVAPRADGATQTEPPRERRRSAEREAPLETEMVCAPLYPAVVTATRGKR